MYDDEGVEWIGTMAMNASRGPANPPVSDDRHNWRQLNREPGVEWTANPDRAMAVPPAAEPEIVAAPLEVSNGTRWRLLDQTRPDHEATFRQGRTQ